VVIQAEKNPIDRSVSVIYLEINLSGEVITHHSPVVFAHYLSREVIKVCMC